MLSYTRVKITLVKKLFSLVCDWIMTCECEWLIFALSLSETLSIWSVIISSFDWSCCIEMFILLSSDFMEMSILLSSDFIDACNCTRNSFTSSSVADKFEIEFWDKRRMYLKWFWWAQHSLSSVTIHFMKKACEAISETIFHSSQEMHLMPARSRLWSHGSRRKNVRLPGDLRLGNLHPWPPLSNFATELPTEKVSCLEDSHPGPCSS